MLSQNDYDLLVLYREPRPRPENAEDEKRFRGLLARKLVEPVGYKPEAGGLTATHYQASQAGKDLLEAFEEQAAQEEKRQAEKEAAEARRLQERHEDYANAERRYRTQNKISVLAILVPFLTFLLGVYVEHFGTILERIRGLFG